MFASFSCPNKLRNKKIQENQHELVALYTIHTFNPCGSMSFIIKINRIACKKANPYKFLPFDCEFFRSWRQNGVTNILSISIYLLIYLFILFYWWKSARNEFYYGMIIHHFNLECTLVSWSSFLYWSFISVFIPISVLYTNKIYMCWI